MEVLAKKFHVDSAECHYDAGIQKYLDGYEISPHPDVRRKALTYMVNINPNPTSNSEQHHTSYLRFKPEWKFVEQYWVGNEKMDRCWVPWSWCEIVKQQTANNSLVAFSPKNDTLHAVKAGYDHLSHQRTQLYGNLWFEDCGTSATPRWEDFVVKPSARKTPRGLARSLVSGYLPQGLKEKMSKVETRAAQSTPLRPQRLDGETNQRGSVLVRFVV